MDFSFGSPGFVTGEVPHMAVSLSDVSVPMTGSLPALRPFEIVDGAIVNQCCVCGRRFIYNSDETDVPYNAVYAYAEITHEVSNADFTLAVGFGNSLPASTMNKSYFPLYKFNDGNVAIDYRTIPIYPFYN